MTSTTLPSADLSAWICWVHGVPERARRSSGTSIGSDVEVELILPDEAARVSEDLTAAVHDTFSYRNPSDDVDVTPTASPGPVRSSRWRSDDDVAGSRVARSSVHGDGAWGTDGMPSWEAALAEHAARMLAPSSVGDFLAPPASSARAGEAPKSAPSSRTGSPMERRRSDAAASSPRSWLSTRIPAQPVRAATIDDTLIRTQGPPVSPSTGVSLVTGQLVHLSTSPAAAVPTPPWARLSTDSQGGQDVAAVFGAAPLIPVARLPSDSRPGRKTTT